MIRATKATKKRLEEWESWAADRFVRHTTVLEEMIRGAEYYERNGNSNARFFYTGDCLYGKADGSEKPVLRALNTLFPKLIEVSFTLGLNEVRILDINKLVKAMIAIAQS